MMINDVHPLVSSINLKPNLSRQIFFLIKTKVKIKINDKAAIVEILISFLIMLAASPAYFLTDITYELDRNPKIYDVGNKTIIDWFSKYEKNVVCIPDKPLMHYLIGNTTILKQQLKEDLYQIQMLHLLEQNIFIIIQKKKCKMNFIKQT